ncbi:MAG: class I SAM-dependent methyltransferase [Thermoguttaceae bacterium]|nr:class I SAM-dependent methyltransferase [Thermoguttaceae bacterium]
MIVKRTCPLCDGSRAELLYTAHYPDSAERILPTEYRIVACETCGFVYDDVDATEDVFNRYYRLDSKYVMKETGGAGGVSDVDMKRFRDVVDFLRPHLPNREIAIADIGCGKGGLLQAFAESGFHHLCAIDASEGCIDYVRKSLGCQTICVDMEHLPEHLEFDLVLCAQIFEHLFHPKNAMAKIAKLLKPNGMFYLEVPDASRYTEYMISPFHYLDVEHINHFSKESLTRLLNRQCFTEVAFRETAISLTQSRLYPCVQALTRYGTEAVLPKMIQRDRPAIMDYLDKSAHATRLMERLFAEIPRGQACYIWGVGAYCQRMLDAGMFDPYHIVGLIDVDIRRQGSCLRGLEIFSPEIIRGKKDCYVLITSALYQDQIAEQLAQMDFKGHIVRLC